MNNKKILIFILFLFICFNTFAFYLFVPDKCKNTKVFITINDLGISSIYDCFDEFLVKDNIKKKLSKNKILYNFVAKIKITFFSNYGKSRDIYKPVIFESDKKKISDLDIDKNQSKKNIKGLLANEEKLKSLLKTASYNEFYYRSWKRSHGNNWNTKFFDLSKINKDNINKLNLAWKFNTIKSDELEKEWKENIEINPIYFDGIVYFVSADWKLNAISADKGELIWSKQFFFQPSRRGMLLHTLKNNKSYILISSGNRLFKLDSKSGRLDKKFGSSGSVHVGKNFIAPVVYKNKIIISDITNYKISGYDLNTGKRNFSMNIHPDNTPKHYATPWSGAALDIKNGLYFLVTGNPKPSLYGVDRPGDNKNSNSLIAIDIEREKILWTFQEVNHDLWDYDISSPPILANLKYNDYFIEAVIITTKTGNTFVFERNSGLSLFDINYKEAPQSNVPNEKTSKFQIYNELPERFAKIEFNTEDIREEITLNSNFYKKFLEDSSYGWFTPPLLGKETIIYGIHGGNNWFGSSFDPINQTLYIPTNNVPYKLRIFPTSIESDTEFKNDNKQAHLIYQKKCSSCHQPNRNGYLLAEYEKEKKYIPSLVGLTIFEPLKNKFDNLESFNKKHKNISLSNDEFLSIKKLFKIWDDKLKKENLIFMESYWLKYYAPDGFLINKTPIGEIVAINILDGKIKWKTEWGYNNGGIASSSSGLIFANGTTDSQANIFDAENGNKLWSYEMEADGSSPPLIYNFKGKEYVSFLSTGNSKLFSSNEKKSSTLYTFSITN